MTAGATEGPLGGRSWFLTTHWSVVASAQAESAPASAAALEQLCQTYWPPLYAFARRLGHSREDAQDLTQEFFARLLARHYLDAANPQKGKFRTFLLLVFKRFLVQEWDRSRAQKRGGGTKPLPLDTELLEASVSSDAQTDPERVYDRKWALLILQRAFEQLRSDSAADQKQFAILKGCLAEEPHQLDYAVLAENLGISEGAARVAAHRFRKRFREKFKTEVAHTLSNPDDLASEVRYLVAVLAD